MQCRSSWSYDDKKLAWPAPSLGPRPPHTRLSSCSLVLATLHCIATLHPTLGLLASHTKLSRSVLNFTLFNSRVLRAFLVFPCPTIKTGGSCSANALLQYPGGSYNTQFDFHAHSQQIPWGNQSSRRSPFTFSKCRHNCRHMTNLWPLLLSCLDTFWNTITMTNTYRDHLQRFFRCASIS